MNQLSPHRGHRKGKNMPHYEVVLKPTGEFRVLVEAPDKETAKQMAIDGEGEAQGFPDQSEPKVLWADEVERKGNEWLPTNRTKS